MAVKLSEKKAIEIIKEVSFAWENDKKQKFLLENLYLVANTLPSLKLYILVLNNMSKFEREVQISFSKMPPDIIDDFFRSFNASSIITLNTYTTVLKTYLAETVSDSSVDIGCIYVNRFKEEDLYKYINQKSQMDKFFTPKTIDDCVNSKKPYDVSTMCAVLMGWCGLTVEEIMQVKKEDIKIDGDFAYINFNDKVYEVKYPNLFKEAMEQTIYTAYDENDNIIKSQRLLEGNEYFISPSIYTSNKKEIEDGIYQSESADPRVLRRRLRELAILLGNKQLNVRNLIISQKIYKVLEFFNFKIPRFTEVKEYKEMTGEDINLATSVDFCRLMLEKIDLEEENQ